MKRWKNLSKSRKLATVILAVIALVAASVAVAAWLASATGIPVTLNAHTP